MVKILNQYELGDMKVVYYIDDITRNVELMLIPASMTPLSWDSKKQEVDSLVQLKLVGDTYLGGYAGGNTMRQSLSTSSLEYKRQECFSKGGNITVVTTLSDSRGYEVSHHLEYVSGGKSVWSYSTFINQSNETVTLELLSSFSLGGITPFSNGDAHDSMKLHRLRSVWSMEGRLETNTLEELQLEPSWAGHAVRAERFGQVGSMPVNRYFPYLVLEDCKNSVCWGAQLAHNASWQMEVYRKDDGVSISGGLADREFGHWMKHIAPMESFTTPKAILSVCIDVGVENISQRLTSALEPMVDAGPKSEQDLPIIFNEYCTTWGSPSHDNITQILEAIKNREISYFVIDCGWYKEEGIPWDIAMGDYQVSSVLFPEGLEKTVEAIKEKGMKPGIWFEIENVGSAAKAYTLEEHLLKRDGKTLTTTMRRFWDMTDPWVEDYLSKRIIETLKQYEFEYMKIDYNDTIGLGCDGAESLGEGLRQNMQASLAFIEKVKKEVPEIILENCASGGHRLEPLMMGATSMASFSDAHECEEIPIIAANLHLAILPRQSQIWAVIRKEDSLKRIAYSIINTFLGRCCLSGDVLELSNEQWEVIDGGIAFYKKIASIIKHGYTKRFGPEIASYRNPNGWQGILRTGEQQYAYALFHVFHGSQPSVLTIDLPGNYEIIDIYSDSNVRAEIKDKQLLYYPTVEMKAVAVFLERI